METNMEIALSILSHYDQARKPPLRHMQKKPPEAEPYSYGEVKRLIEDCVHKINEKYAERG